MNLGNLVDSVGVLSGGLFNKHGFALSGKAPAGQEQHPWVQQVARNVGHGLLGDSIGNTIDQRMFGDISVDPHASNDQLNSPNNLALQQMLQSWLQPKS